MSMFKGKGMEYVYEVYKEKSFSKAARNLFISQPSLSAAVKKVEQEIGCELFDRSTTPIRLTECGVVYIESIKKVMEIEESFDNFKNDLENLTSGSISIGGTTFFTSFVLPPIIRHFSEKYPKIAINLVETNTGKLEKELFEGGVDLVIDNYRFDNTLYEGHFFAKEQLVLAVPRNYLPKQQEDSSVRIWLSADDIKKGKHLKEETQPVPLHWFQGMPFLFLKEGNDTRIRAERICAHSGFKPNIILMLEQQLTAYNFACQGMGITFISDTLARSEKPDAGIVYYKLENQDSSRNVSFYYKKTRYMKRAVREFLKIADEVAEKQE